MNKHYNTILSLLEKCRTMTELKQLHGLMIKTRVIRNIIPSSKLIDFCSNPQTGNLKYARSVFDLIDHPSVYIWNSMIKGYSNGGGPDDALILYREMLRKGYSPNHFTFPFVFKACLVTTDLNYGKCVHSYISKTGFEENLYVSTCLLHVYVSCGETVGGLKVFDEIPKRNIVAWSSLIAGFVHSNQFNEAIRVFKNMIQYDVEPNEITMVNVLVACARTRDIDTGKWVHGIICQMGLDPFSKPSARSNVILATAIMDMYGKCGELRTARYLFDEMPHRNLVSWNSIITAYSQYGDAEEALCLFSGMQVTGFEPDKATFLNVIRACTHIGSLQLGQSIHAYVSKTAIVKETSIVTALVDMYAKTGDAKSAQRIFSELDKKDTMAWTSMIIGLASHGHGEEALITFRRMQDDTSVSPDKITYIAVLCACSHVGSVEEGQRHFMEMRNLYGIEPTVEHYGCMVDLLSRAGQFEEAERLVQTMPVPPNLNILGALLNGCEIHENIDLADRIRHQLTKLEQLGSGIYVLLSNIYAKAGRWHEVKLTREMMKRRRIEKALGHSSVETK